MDESSGRPARDPILDWLGTIAVTLLALFLRLWHLRSPQAFLFDETYYAKDAWSLVHHGYVLNYVQNADQKILAGQSIGLWKADPSMVVHPEVGKWLIGLGELVFGLNPLGWRFSSAVIGSLMVLVMIRLARRVTGSTVLGLTAGLILCFDGLELTLSRLALLDIYVAFFSLCAVSCLVADRDWARARITERVTGRAWGPRLWWRPWRLASGVFWGLALGSKWDAVFLLAALGILSWLWDAGARRRVNVQLPVLKAAVVDALPGVGYLVLVPFLVYVATWTGWLLHAHAYEATLSDTQYGPYWGSYLKHDARGFFPELWQSLRSLYHYHHDVYTFHTKFLNDATHSYASKPEGWFLLNRPVNAYSLLDIKPGEQGCSAPAGQTCLRQVLIMGSPAVWWGGALAAIWAAVTWVFRRDWRYGLVVVGVAATWLPWIRYDQRPIFSYYAIMSLPFLVLALTLVVGQVLGRAAAGRTRRTVGAAFAGGIVLVVLVTFAFFWPIWTEQLITNHQWLERMWFRRWI